MLMRIICLQLSSIYDGCLGCRVFSRSIDMMKNHSVSAPTGNAIVASQSARSGNRDANLVTVSCLERVPLRSLVSIEQKKLVNWTYDFPDRVFSNHDMRHRAWALYLALCVV
jgi:hypothetical protein